MTSTLSRRDALLGTAGALIGLHAVPRVQGAEQPRNVPQMGVELAIATICADGFGDVNFDPSFRLIPQAGFRNVEFNCWYPRTLTIAGIDSIRARCAAAGLKPICVQGSSFRDGKVADVAHKLWCMEAARRLGCNRVKFTGSRRGTNGGLSAIIAALRALAPAAEEMGMLICVENHANNNLENVSDYEQLFEAIDSPNVGLCLDTGHFDGAAVDIPEVIEKFHDRTVHVDLKDCVAKGTYKTVNFGDGVTDLHGTVERLLQHGYRGYLVVEQAPPVRPDHLLEDLQAAFQMFQKYEARD